jgi:CRISPR/Cas system-associated protein Cas10 (large subunit of type III CRISPR-Cas system)
MKTMPQKYQLKVDEIYTSSENKKILSRLIPELLDSLAPRFNPSRKQLNEWLGALHRHQRGRYRKTQTGKLDTDNRRLYANSRLSEVRTIRLLYIHCFICTNF